MAVREEAAMGTAMRFITASGGVVLIVLAWGLFGYPIIQTIAEPEYADFPGGAAGIVVMLLLMGSVPFGGGVLLIRRAVRGAARDQTITDDVRGLPQSSTSAPASLVAGVVEAAPPIASSLDIAATAVPPEIEPRGTTIAGAPVGTETNTPVQPPQTTRDTEDVRPQRKRRTWLAMLGLAIALGAFLFDAIVVLGAVTDDTLSLGANVVILVGFLLLSAIPLLGGLRLAHAGDPEMGRRFVIDLRARAGQLRHPLGLVRTSAGLAFVIALVSMPAMITWRDASPIIGPYAMTVFSFIDPLVNIRRPSWWGGAFVSAASCFVLFLVTAVTTDAVTNQPDVQIGFILPLMVYPATMALSGLIRFLLWLGRESGD
ncbi:hypothetical protein [Luteitalea pratensis]|nr:hypothetical protein [Luteitalea pratensis]